MSMSVGSDMLDHNALVSAMLSYSEQQFINALRTEPEERNIHVSHSLNLWRYCKREKHETFPFFFSYVGPSSHLWAPFWNVCSVEAAGIRAEISM